MLTKEKKLELVKSLCWDYDVSLQSMLDVIEGRAESADGVFDREKLLVRSLERLPWHYEENLYPIQDGVMNIVSRCNVRFYLTGGTKKNAAIRI